MAPALQVSSEASFPGPTAAHGPRVDSVSDLGRLSEQDLAAVAGALIQGAPPPQLLSTGAPLSPPPPCRMHDTHV